MNSSAAGTPKSVSAVPPIRKYWLSGCAGSHSATGRSFAPCRWSRGPRRRPDGPPRGPRPPARSPARSRSSGGRGGRKTRRRSARRGRGDRGRDRLLRHDLSELPLRLQRGDRPVERRQAGSAACARDEARTGERRVAATKAGKAKRGIWLRSPPKADIIFTLCYSLQASGATRRSRELAASPQALLRSFRTCEKRGDVTGKEAPHRRSKNQPQPAHPKTFGHQTVLKRYHVGVVILWKPRSQAVRRLGRLLCPTDPDMMKKNFAASSGSPASSETRGKELASVLPSLVWQQNSLCRSRPGRRDGAHRGSGYSGI